MEGRKMQKEISYEKALKVLERGEAVKCQHGIREDQFEIVHSVQQLNNLYELSKQGVQLCKIYPISQKEEKLSEDVIEMDFDEAYKMLISEEIIFYKNEDGEEDEITTVSELINLRRASETRGKKLILYWHE